MNLHSTIRRILKEETQNPKILRFPSLEFFDNDPFEALKIIQKILQKKGNPLYLIDGELDLSNLKTFENPGNLVPIGNLVSIEYLNLRSLPIKELNSLVQVKESLFLQDTLIKSLPNLEYVGSYLELKNTPIEFLPKLKHVGGTLGLRNSKIQNIDSLLSAKSIFVANTPIKTLGNIKFLSGTLNLEETKIEDLRGLKEVGFNLHARSSAIESLGALQSVGADLDLSLTKIDSLGKLTFVGGNLNLYGTPLSDRLTREEILNTVTVIGDLYM